MAPDGALGGEAVLACMERGVPLITVANPSVLAVSAEVLGLDHGVQRATSYAEAAGWLLALREGVATCSLQRPLPSLERLT